MTGSAEVADRVLGHVLGGITGRLCGDRLQGLETESSKAVVG